MNETPAPYELLTHVDLATLPRDRTVVLLPISPLEEHAPHLPLGTDALIAAECASEFARRARGKLPDWRFVQLPTFYAGASTQVYLGSIEITPELVRAYLRQTCRKLAEDGFQRAAIFSAHGGPSHVQALAEETKGLDQELRHCRVKFANETLIPNWLSPIMVDEFAAFAGRMGLDLSAEERLALRTDSHAGLVETALLLALRPEWVRPSYADLEPAFLEDSSKVGPTTGATVGRGLGHIGTPHLARAELGRSLWEFYFDRTLPEMLEWMGD